MEPDEIESIVDTAIDALKDNKTADAMFCLGQIKAHCSNATRNVYLWDLVRQDYESGLPPRRIAQKYGSSGVTEKEIYNRSYSQNWVSPLKLKKHLKPTQKKRFFPDCRICEQRFEAASGHASVCPTCKAADAMNAATGKARAR